MSYLVEVLAYAAGIIDGEGCIRISDIKSKQYPYRELNVSVQTTDEVLTYWLKDTFGGCLSIKNRYEGMNPKHKSSNRWILTCRKASKFLELILPYLKLKVPQAKLGIEFQNTRCWGAKNRWNQKTEEDWRYEEHALEQMHKLNKRGTNEN